MTPRAHARRVPERPIETGESLHAAVATDLASVRREWSAVAMRGDNIFATWEWADAWWRHFGGANRLRVVVCRDAAGAVRFVVPLPSRAGAAAPRRPRACGRARPHRARPGHRTRFTLHVRFSAGPREGFIALFGDDGRGGPTRRLLAGRHLATLKVDPAHDSRPVASHARIGVYRDRRISGTAVAYYDAYTVATTRRAAENDVP